MQLLQTQMQLLQEQKQLQDKQGELYQRVIQGLESKTRLETERAQVFRDASYMYERGIVELQLHLLFEKHESKQGTQFRCNGVWHNKSFTSLMKHWYDCERNGSQPPVVQTQYKEGMITISESKDNVENAIKNLYQTLSAPAHFNIGDSYPIRIHPFDSNAKTLALITFFHHHSIPFTVVAAPAAPQSISVSSSSSSTSPSSPQSSSSSSSPS
eukprot:gb/GEZN01011672.1/.p1 GENE.gb/GEZN01011672.1/~~gb/GEZN01011672.1/.p1  ORF type:complete len:213 (-),score=42.86 gb/GEZN01011672.1/:23-661(-)